MATNQLKITIHGNSQSPDYTLARSHSREKMPAPSSSILNKN